jgi:hypothetical protein
LKNLKLIIFGLLVIALFSYCEKDENDLRLGETISNYKTDTVYFSTTDGLLSVEYEDDGSIHSLGKPIAKIYADENINPVTEVGIVYYSITVPIRENLYWKVKKMTKNKINIRWTPIY